MPYKVIKRGDKYRVVDPITGRLAKNRGTVLDGGGHASKEKARRQVRAIMSRER